MTGVLSLAHAGVPLAPHQLWRAWTLEPAVLVGLAAVAAAYGRGLRRLWHGRGRVVTGRQVGAFAAGMAVITLALLSPLDTLAQVSFAAHMAQHMLLVMVAAPLLVLGAPGLPLTVALTPSWRRRLVLLRRRPPGRPGRPGPT